MIGQNIKRVIVKVLLWESFLSSLYVFKRILKKLKKSNATGMDEISANLVKEFELELLPFLVHIINRAIMSDQAINFLRF